MHLRINNRIQGAGVVKRQKDIIQSVGMNGGMMNGSDGLQCKRFQYLAVIRANPNRSAQQILQNGPVFASDINPVGKTRRSYPPDAAGPIDVDDLEDIIQVFSRAAFFQPQNAALRAQEDILVFCLPGDKGAEIMPEKDIERIEPQLKNLPLQVVYP
ncbi:MAG: hypothetical protein GY952_09845, partial [Rhodobacteraceae bacterium]|nr:hypothetical protein [Paracoccaceae bacterium]